MNTDELIGSIAVWGQEHHIDTIDKQTVKLLEECGEFASEIARSHYDTPEVKDAVGDIGVVLVILADMLGLDFGNCLEEAYNVIKDRKGRTINGGFVKES